MASVDKGTVIGGSISALVGAFFIVISFADSRDDAFPSGRTPVLLAGAAFFFAGAAAVVGTIQDEPLRKGLNTLLGGLAVATLVGVPMSFGLEKGSPPGVSWVCFSCLGLMGAAILYFAARSVRELARAGRTDAAAILAGAALALVGGSGAAIWGLHVGWPSTPGPPVFDPAGAWEGDLWGEVVFEKGKGNLFKGRYAGSKFFEGGTLEVTVYDTRHPSGHAWGRWRAGSGEWTGTLSLWHDPDEGTLTGTWTADSAPPGGGPTYGSFGWRPRAEEPPK